MELFAITTNGMNQNNTLSITGITVWIDRTCNQKVDTYSLDKLIEGYYLSGKMTITAEGKIDSFEDTPLYTNGQKSVIRIEDINGSIIWDRKFLQQPFNN